MSVRTGMRVSAYTQVRSVNGDGPTCGCGKRSRLHVTRRDEDYFLCEDCTLIAVRSYCDHSEQPDQGPPPGDYFTGLLRREHVHHSRPVRWCPDCPAPVDTATGEGTG